MKKNRIRQRKALLNKLREEAVEEMLEYRDCCGIPDPTPYEAIKNCIIKEQNAVLRNMAKEIA